MKYVFTILLLSCNTKPVDTAELGYEFADQWLQLDNFYQDTCFYLNSLEKNIILYDKDEEEVESKDWYWEFYPPDLFIIDDRELIAIKDNDCWYLEAYGITSTACDCNLDIP